MAKLMKHAQGPGVWGWQALARVFQKLRGMSWVGKGAIHALRGGASTLGRAALKSAGGRKVPMALVMLPGCWKGSNFAFGDPAAGNRGFRSTAVCMMGLRKSGFAKSKKARQVRDGTRRAPELKHTHEDYFPNDQEGERMEEAGAQGGSRGRPGKNVKVDEDDEGGFMTEGRDPMGGRMGIVGGDEPEPEDEDAAVESRRPAAAKPRTASGKLSPEERLMAAGLHEEDAVAVHEELRALGVDREPSRSRSFTFPFLYPISTHTSQPPLKALDRQNKQTRNKAIDNHAS